MILNADDGKILTTLPIGNGTDGGAYQRIAQTEFDYKYDRFVNAHPGDPFPPSDQ